MTTDFQRHRLMFCPYKTLAIVALLSAVFAIQMLAGTAMAGGSYEPPKRPTLAPLLHEKSPERIPGQYIVIFKPGTTRDVVLAAQNNVKKLGGTIRTTYTLEPIGFSAELPQSALQALRKLPDVAYIEVNQAGSLNITQITQNLDAPPNRPMGLDRTSERFLGLDGKYTYSETGAGVHVYVIDTGIFKGHSEFDGRVDWGMNTTYDIDNSDPAFAAAQRVLGAADTGDCNGHGTHVAGIIGGKTFGIAKGVTLHPVRYTNCPPAGDSLQTSVDYAVKAVDWIKNDVIEKRTADASYTAVVNFSSTLAMSTTLNTRVENSAKIAPFLTYVVAAGNDDLPACNFSLASITGVYKPIVVGAIDPINDTRTNEHPVYNGHTLDIVSNHGSCLTLFAPGTKILSTWPDTFNVFPGCNLVKTTLGSRTQSCSGTSMAAPHVTGVVARILSRLAPNTPLSSPPTPNAVWNALHFANNHAGTSGWAGVGSAGTGSPNEMLHYGSDSDGKSDGDTHITTVNGIHYDFQAAGEFVALRDANGMEIQTRQTSVPSAPSVSVNTAIAARVGQHRVSWQPNISGVPDPSGLQLRVDGVVTTIGENGFDLGDGGRIMKSAAGDTLEVDFPDGTALFATATWWAGQNQWYLDVNVFHTTATEGIMGAIEQNSWLQQEFAATWGVTNETSLFDYATGLSSNTFAISSVPQDQIPPINSEVLALAQRVCESFIDPKTADTNRLADCAFDIAVTRDPIFAKSHRLAQRIQQGATTTTVRVERNLRRIREEVTLITTVTRHGSLKGIPTGSVMFLLDGKELGKPVTLDANGQAQWKMSSHRVDGHRVTTKYIPDKDSVFLPSNSLDKTLAVEKKQIPHGGAGSKKLYRK